MIENPNAPEPSRRGHAKLILRSQIEEAQRHTNSNAAAARWLNVSYKIYKKYATLYGLFEKHLNPTGLGIEKGFSKRPTSIPLRDVLAGKHPNYSLAKLRNRLIARGKLTEQCHLCGFDERRITDNRVPVMLTFKDGNHTNYSLENLELRCYNCMFLTTGAPTVVNKRHIKKSFAAPEKIPQSKKQAITTADYYDTIEDLQIDAYILTDEEKNALLDSLS